MEKNKYRVSLRILDFDFDPEEITFFTGVLPSKIWRKGDLLHPNAKTAIIKQNGWEVSPDVGQHEIFNDQVEALMSKIKPFLQKLIDVSKDYYTELSCVLYLYYNEDEECRPTPSISFNSETVEILSKLKANIDIDLYVL